MHATALAAWPGRTLPGWASVDFEKSAAGPSVWSSTIREHLQGVLPFRLKKAHGLVGWKSR
jgi:hypothetical protein